MNQTEKIAYEQLKKDGYEVEKPTNQLVKTKKGYICLHHDLWGLWDFCAVSKKHIRFIQVSSKYLSQRSGADQERMLAFPKLPNTQKEYWRWDAKTKRFYIEQL